MDVLDAEVVVVKSDTAISTELRDELRAAVCVLENVPDSKKDWHPGSHETVLDLVHPSLFPVVWGLTRALEEGTVPLDGCIMLTSKGTTLAEFKPEVDNQQNQRHLYSVQTPNLWGSFQWLPAEVELGEDGGAKITSYVNNLHPARHKNIYVILERIIAATVPLWKETLNGFGNPVRLPLQSTGSFDYIFPPGLMYRVPGGKGNKAFWDPVAEEYCAAQGDQNAPGDAPDTAGHGNEEDDEFDDDWRDDEDYEDWFYDHRLLKFYDPPAYTSQTVRARMRGEEGAWKGLAMCNGFPANFQVIFKLANIHLTPEKPTYDGGAWHVEGTLNERICASAIYYYEQDNISDSHLAFRQCLNVEELSVIPEQNEYSSFESYLGVRNGNEAIQELGQVLTREGRLLVFPNCLQHQVQPFRLKDRSRPGYRKILAMFLVDPHRPILSSAHVPSQRRDWWADEVRGGGGLSALPTEIFDLTMDMIDNFPISWEQAVEIRARLMEERRGFTKKLNQVLSQVSYFVFEKLSGVILTWIYRKRLASASTDMRRLRWLQW